KRLSITGIDVLATNWKPHLALRAPARTRVCEVGGVGFQRAEQRRPFGSAVSAEAVSGAREAHSLVRREIRRLAS
ncbi:hypothetical protein MC885_002382, partial [Smutsia gigantea]